jgi:ketosteroid isomerase-like protein
MDADVAGERWGEIVRRNYVRINDAYKTGDYLQPMEEICHPDVVLRTSGMFPESRDYQGYDGLREFTRSQAEAFEQMWVQPAEFVDADDRIVVPVRFGGKARHTGIETALSVAHVWTIHGGKVSRLDMYRSREQALEAVGLQK